MKYSPLSPMTLGVLLMASTQAFASSNLILNGDFENNGATPGESQYNLDNAAFSALVQSTTAFGGSNELDLYTAGAGYIVDPQSGAWQVRLHGNGVDLYDAFSFWLSSPLTSGASYHLRFYVAGIPGINPIAPVELAIGLSNDPADFGTLLYTGQGQNGDGGWRQYDLEFVAPMTASYLTVRNASVFAGVDNFTLSPVPEPETWAMLGMGLALMGWKTRRHP